MYSHSDCVDYQSAPSLLRSGELVRSREGVFVCFSLFGIFPFSFEDNARGERCVVRSKTLSVVPVFSLLLVVLNYISIVNNALNGTQLIRSMSSFVYNSCVFVSLVTGLLGAGRTLEIFNFLLSSDSTAPPGRRYTFYYGVVVQLVVHRAVEVLVYVSVAEDPSFEEVLSIFLYVVPFAHLLFFALVLQQFRMSYADLGQSLAEIRSATEVRSVRLRYVSVTRALNSAVSCYGAANFAIVSGVTVHLVETVHGMVERLGRGSTEDDLRFGRLVVSASEGVLLLINLTVCQRHTHSPAGIPMRYNATLPITEVQLPPPTERDVFPWLFSSPVVVYRPSNFITDNLRPKLQNESLAETILNTGIDTIDTSTLHEMVEFVEDVSRYRVNISANRCFTIDASLMFSIFGILTSYILVIAPLESIKNKD
ncbi:hypothetical protein AAG570_003293 [Ranatra chinensis]|uniref:Gustatory receptor n=1 Tax=Ranatra chinensis TaxID=642074 RepID=A0ABD0YUU2_9HEMI